MLIIITSILIIITGLVYWFNRQASTAAIYERLNYGFPEPEVVTEEDLMDPAYGLTGTQRKIQEFHYFLTSWKGKSILLILGGILGYSLSQWYDFPIELQGLSSIAVAAILLMVANLIINSRAKKRRNAIRKELPYTLEMLAALMKGGLAFETSMQHIIRESDKSHPLYFELTTMFESMQRGRRRAEAFRLLDRRCKVFEVTELASAAIQVDQTGGSIGDVFRHHAKTVFRENEAEIRRKAEKLPVKMMFPMLFTIFPSLFVVLLLPNLLRLFKVMDAMRSGLN